MKEGIAMDKKMIRKKYLNSREEMSLYEIELFNKKIFSNLISNHHYQKSNSIFTYVSIGNEVDTRRMIDQALKDGKKVAVPKIFGKGKMKFYYIQSLKELAKAKFDLLEPIHLDTEATSNGNSIFIVPGVAFDLSKNRIGYGGGYYDRYLSKASYEKTIALAYERQLVDLIPSDLNDIKMNLIITEKKIYS